MRKMWMIYPTRPVKGFTATYMPVEGDDLGIRAASEAIRMHMYSKVKWAVKLVNK